MAPRGEGAVDKEGGELMRIPEFLSPRGGTGTRSELNSKSHTRNFREREQGEAVKWRMEGHGERTAYRFTNCLSP